MEFSWNGQRYVVSGEGMALGTTLIGAIVIFILIALFNGSTLRVNPAAMKASAFFLPNIIAGMVASIGMIIGSLGPWITLLAISRSALGGDGTITLILGGIALIALFTITNLARTRARSGFLIVLAIVAVLAGGLTLTATVIDAIEMSSGESIEIFGSTIGAEIGWGLWLTMLSSAVVVLTSLVVLIQVKTVTAAAYR